MELKVTTLDGKAAGSVDLKDEVFGLEVRPDILHRMVRYQQLKELGVVHSAKEFIQLFRPDEQEDTP